MKLLEIFLIAFQRLRRINLVDWILCNGLLIFLWSERMREMQYSQQGCGELQLNDNALCVKIIPRARWFPEE